MYFQGQGKPVVLKRKAFGRELEKTIQCDAHLGVRVVGIDPVKEIIQGDRSTDKIIQRLEAQGFEIKAPEKQEADGPAPRCRVLYFQEGGARRHATVFESDERLNLFDDLKVGDVINISGVKMGFNGVRAYHVEKAEPATPPAATAA